MAYTLLLYWIPGSGPADGSAALEAEFDAWESLTEQMSAAGILIANEAVQEPSTAVTLGAGLDAAGMTGPATGDERTLFAFYVLDVEDPEVAESWARRLPHLDYGWVEIRPTM